MTRDLKILGLALGAVLVLGVVAAPMAGAQTQGRFTTDGTRATLDMAEDGSNFFAYPGLPGPVECPGSTAVGHETFSTPHAEVPANATSMTITPKFATCFNAGHRVTITMNGCDFVFHVGTTAGVTDTYSLSTDVSCTFGTSIEVHVYLSAGTSTTLICTIKIPSQVGIAGFALANEIEGGQTNDTLTATGKSFGVSATKEGLCGSGSTGGAELEMNYTITGTNASGSRTGVTITES